MRHRLFFSVVVCRSFFLSITFLSGICCQSFVRSSDSVVYKVISSCPRVRIASVEPSFA